MDTKSHDTPWGFTLEDAIEAFEYRRHHQAQPSEEEAMKNWVTRQFAQVICKVEGCTRVYEKDKNVVLEYPELKGKQRYGLGDRMFCADHYIKVWRLRYGRELAKRAAKDRLKLEAEREQTLRWLPDRVDRMEVREQREWLREAKRAYQLSLRPARYSGPPRTGYVYKLYDIENVLLYVGKTYNVNQRLFGVGGHSQTKDWWEIVAEAEVLVYRTERDALDAEAHAIKRGAPKFNITQPVPRTPRSPRRVAAYRGWVSAYAQEPLRI